MRAALLAILIGLSTREACAQWPVARLHSVFPAGGAAGSEVVLTVTGGEDLIAVTELRFSHPGITAKREPPAAETPAQPQAPKFRVSIGADVAPGDYEVRSAGATGISNPRRFVVSGQPEVEETEPNDAPGRAMPLEIEQIVNARSLPARDVDCYRLAGQAGQTLVVECRAAGIDSRMSPWIEVWQAGRRLASGWQPRGDDLYLPVRVAQDGELSIRLQDFEYAGGEDRGYRLRVSQAPFISHAIPAALEPGSTCPVTLFGWNLPNGQAASEAGGLESVAINVAAPADEAWSINQGPAVTVGQANWEFPAPWALAPLRPIRFWKAAAPIELEGPNNDAPATAQAIEPPREICGQFDRPGDVDWYVFTTPADGVYWIDVRAERCQFGADPVLRVERVERTAEGQEKIELLKTEDDDGDNPGGRDFATRSADPRFRLAAVAGGHYRVAVRDLRTTDGESYVVRPPALYRLAVRPARPGFMLVAQPEFPIQPEQRSALWSLHVRRGGAEKLKIIALRQDGFAGPITVTATGLPPGVSCAAVTLGPGQAVTYLVLSAAADAADWRGAIQVQGRADIDGATFECAAVSAAMVWPGGDDFPAVSRLTNEIPLAVGGSSAFRIEPAEPRLRTYQQRRWPIMMRIARTEGFTGPVTLTPYNLPPNAKCEPITIGAGAAEGAALLMVEDVPPGEWTVLFRGEGRLPKLDAPPVPARDNVQLVEPALPLQLEVLPGPLTLAAAAPADGRLTRGAAMSVPITIARRNGFAGEVRLSLALPAPVAGLTCEPVSVAADANQGVLAIHCAADAPAGPQPTAAIRAEVEFGGAPVIIEQPIVLTIP